MMTKRKDKREGTAAVLYTKVKHMPRVPCLPVLGHLFVSNEKYKNGRSPPPPQGRIFFDIPIIILRVRVCAAVFVRGKKISYNCGFFMIGCLTVFFCVVIPQACPLNPTPAPSNGQQQLLQDFSERFLPAIRDVVEFAKRLPGFTLLAEDDKVTLLKPGVFEVLLVRLAAMFDSQVNKKKTKREFDWEMFDIHLI